MIEHKSLSERGLKFRSGGILHGVQREINFARVRAMYKRVHFVLLQPFFFERRLRVRAVYKRAFSSHLRSVFHQH